jgi:two-component system alkaline phosphatase synthesis response regulator PhoP
LRGTHVVAARKHILVVEDEEDILELLRFNLVKEGFSVATATRGEDGLKAVAQKRPDIILLDLMLPGLNGLEVCRKLKGDPKTAGIPIVMVTAKGEEADIVVGLEVGADDYVTKPFSIKVLISRVRVTLRRQQSQAYDPKTEVHIRDLEISPSRFQVFANGKAIEGLTVTDFRLLHFLASRSGWVLNRQQILDAVRGEEVAVTERAVDVQMVSLRKKLGQRADYIEAVRGVGYRFKDA